MQVWPDAATFEANAAERLAPGQQVSPDALEPIKPPYIGLAIVASALPIGALLWRVAELGMGIWVGLVVVNIGLATMSMNFDRRRRRKRLRAALRMPIIRGGVGEVVPAPGGAGVLVRVGDSVLEPNPAVARPLPPGWYQMYWMEHPGAQRWDADRLLLSARLIERAEPEHGPSSAAGAAVAQALSQALRFTADDLAHNRAGGLSQPQRRALRRRLRGVTIWATIGILFGLSMLADSTAGLLRPPPPDSTPRQELIFALVFGSVALIIMALVLWAALRRRRAHLALWHSAAPVAHVAGTAVVTEIDRSNNDWSVTVGEGPKFHVGTDVAQAFLTPGRYQVNYLPDRRPLMLSAVPVVAEGESQESWPPPPQASAAVQAALDERLHGLARQRRIRRALVAMVPALIITAATAVPHIVHHFHPRQAVLSEDATDLKITLIAVAVWVAAWAAYAVSGKRRQRL